MKSNFLKSIICLVGVGMLTYSCSTETEKLPVDFDALNTSGGAFASLLSATTSPFTVSFTNPSSSETTNVYQLVSPQSGEDVTAFNWYVSFTDNTPENGDNSKAEALLLTSVDFTGAGSGYPEVEVTANGGDMLTALGLSVADITAGDSFFLRIGLATTSGIEYSKVSNNFDNQSADHSITANVVCPPTVPTAGDWTFDLQDSYGDGWNNATLDVTLDGELTQIFIDDGLEETVIFPVPSGSEVISIIFRSGDWDSEITFQVYSANGNQILNLGPSPDAGIELLDYCLDNL
jgi:hypothetical protein